MNIKLPAEHHLEVLSIKVGFTGSSESTFVNIPNCWKSHVAAHIVLHFGLQKLNPCLNLDLAWREKTSLRWLRQSKTRTSLIHRQRLAKVLQMQCTYVELMPAI